MRIAIWGTGGNASRFIKCYSDLFESAVDLVSIIDDCEARRGKYFFGYVIKYITDIKGEDIDYIVRLDTYNGYDMVKAKQVLGDTLSRCLIEENDFIKKVVEETDYWQGKRVLFYGNKINFVSYDHIAKYTFKNHRFLSDSEAVNTLENIDYVFLCPSWFTKDDDSLREQETEFRNKLKKVSNYKSKIVLDFNVWSRIMQCDRRVHSYGEKNPDKSFFVITVAREWGWAPILQHVFKCVSYAQHEGMIPIVDMKYAANQYLRDDEFGNVNAWEKFFEQLADYDLEEVYHSKNVVLAGLLDHENEKPDFSRFVIRADIKAKIDAEIKRLFGNENNRILGVVYRATDYVSALGHQNPMDVDDFISEIRKNMAESNCSKIFLATEAEEIANAFKKAFGDDVIFTDQQRYSISERNLLATVHFNRENDEYKKGIEYLTVLEALRRCDVLIGSNCGATRLAMAINPECRFIKFIGVNPDSCTVKSSSYIYKIEKIARFIRRKLEIGEYKKMEIK